MIDFSLHRLPYHLMPATPPPIPALYYLRHFRDVLGGVSLRYGFLLDERERRYLATLDALSEPALCLYARLVNRAGPCFRVAKFAYPEIPSLPDAMAELFEAGLLHLCDGAEDAALRQRLLGCFTQAELAAALKPHAPRRLPRKEALLAWIDAWDGCRDWLAAHLAQHRVVRLADDDPWPFLRFLFFGELTDNLSAFVTRELGHRVPETVQPEALAAYFTSRREALDVYRMAHLYEEFRVLRETQSALETLRWWQAQGITREGLAERARPCHDRLINRLGRRLEREGEAEAAMALYPSAPVAPCRERLARLWLKAGETEKALALCREIATAPHHAEEEYAACQLIARIEKSVRRSAARHYHIESPQITVETDLEPVEAAVLAHHAAEGWSGVHGENWLWNALFGLLLWEVIYDPAHGGFHSPLQLAPADLFERDFYARRREAIEAALSSLSDPTASIRRLQATYAAKEGIANPFVFWHPDLIAVLAVLIERAPPVGLAAILRRMAQDLRRRRRGFPDLFLWRDHHYRFVEVKSATDHLSPHQYQWLRFFAEAGLEVTLERVERRVHPCVAAE